MHAAGVTCVDCHDPHSGKLKPQGAEVCGAVPRGEIRGREAHGHHRGSPGAQCIACHMPRTYMVVHARQDHSIRIPRPDRTLSGNAQRLQQMP